MGLSLYLTFLLALKLYKDLEIQYEYLWFSSSVVNLLGIL